MQVKNTTTKDQDSTSNKVKQIIDEIEDQEIRCYGLSKKMKTEITNIAKNHSMTLSGFLKLEYRKIIDSYPEHLRK